LKLKWYLKHLRPFIPFYEVMCSAPHDVDSKQDTTKYKLPPPKQFERSSSIRRRDQANYLPSLRRIPSIDDDKSTSKHKLPAAEQITALIPDEVKGPTSHPFKLLVDVVTDVPPPTLMIGGATHSDDRWRDTL
jgi:hypothetical protein